MLALLPTLFLQAAPARNGFDYGQLAMFAVIGVIFYFFILRPQQKKQSDAKKAAAEFLEALKKGDSVVTIGGLHGKVAGIEGDLVILDVDRGTKLVFDKVALSVENSKKAAGETKTPVN